MKPKFASLLAAMLAALLLSPATSSQSTPPASQSAKPDDQLKLSTDLVSLKVTVADSFGRVVTGLRQENFEIYDDKVQQQIAHFIEADAPISIGIIYDVSGSMDGIIRDSLTALRRFIETSHEDDDFFLIGFNDHAKLVQDFTTSGDRLLGRLLLVKPRGSTALYDAVYLGVEKVEQGRHPKRALLIISDGEDNSSRYNFRQLRQLVREAGVQVYAIKIGGPWSYGADVAGARSFPSTITA